MNPDLELIQQYAQAIQATGLLEEDTVNGITAMVDRARDQFRVADEQGIPRETLQLLPDDQRAAMQEVLMQVQRSYGARSEGEMMNARSRLAADKAMPQGLSEEEMNRFRAQKRAAIQSDRMSVKSSKMNQDGSTDMVMSDGSLKRGPTNFGAMSEGEISPDTIYENIDGLDIARRPTAPATSLRPKPRQANLGTMGPTPQQMRP